MHIKTGVPYDLLYYKKYNGKATLLVKEYSEPADNYFLPHHKNRIAVNRRRILNGVKAKTTGGDIFNKWFTLHTEVGNVDCYLKLLTYSFQIEEFFRDGMCIEFNGKYPNITCTLYTPDKSIVYDLADKLSVDLYRFK